MTTRIGGDLVALRRGNAKAVLTALMAARSPETVTELAATTGLSRPTVETALADLVESRTASVSPAQVRSGRGRPARQYRYAAERGVVIGLDSGPNGVRGIVADLAGRALAEHALTGRDLSLADNALTACDQLIDHLLARTAFGRHDVAALGLGVPGVVNAGGSLVLTRVVEDWVSGELPARLGHLVPGALVMLDNDAKLAARAEVDFGAIDLGQSAVVLQVGNRLAAATVIDGQIARGAHGAAGEVGALGRLGWPQALSDLETKAERFGSIRGLFGASGVDSDAAEATAIFAERIADGLAALILAIDPDTIVLGGRIVAAGEQALVPLKAALEPRCVFVPHLAMSALGSRASVLGAVSLAAAKVREGQLAGV